MDLHVGSSASKTTTTTAAAAAAINTNASHTSSTATTTALPPIPSLGEGHPTAIRNHPQQQQSQSHSSNIITTTHTNNSSSSNAHGTGGSTSSNSHSSSSTGTGSSTSNSSSGGSSTTSTTGHGNHHHTHHSLLLDATSLFSPENVASLPPPGLSAPSQALFLHSHLLSYVAVVSKQQKPHLQQQQQPLPHKSNNSNTSSSSNSSGSSNSSNNTSNHGGGNTRSSSTRSLYRPLTTSSISSTPSNNNNNNNMSATTTQQQSKPVTSSSSHHSSTERVLMCLDLRSLIRSNGNHDGSSKAEESAPLTVPVHTTTPSPSKTTAPPPPIPVPLLRWNHRPAITSTPSTAATATFYTRASDGVTTVSSTTSLSTTPTLHGSSGDGFNNGSHRNLMTCTADSTGTTNTTSTTRPTAIRSMSKRRALSSSAITSTSHTKSETSVRDSVTMPFPSPNTSTLSLEERLRRERQRYTSSFSAVSGSLTQFSWVFMKEGSIPSSNRRIEQMSESTNSLDKKASCLDNSNNYRLLIPSRGNLYIQNGINLQCGDEVIQDDSLDGTALSDQSFQYCVCIHDKSTTGLSANDAQLSPDGSMVAWTCEGELYVQSAEPRLASATSTSDARTTSLATTTAMMLDDSCSAASLDDNNSGTWHTAADLTAASTTTPAVLISFGASRSETCSITHGVADFVAQEEMDRYRGFWWHPDSNAILFTRNDESDVPIYRIMHHSNNSALPPSSFSTSSSSASMHNDHGNSQHFESSNSSRGFAPPPKSNHASSSIYEDFRYPFAGRANPVVKLALVQVDRESILNQSATQPTKSAEISKPTLSQTAEARDGVESSTDRSCRRNDDSDDPMQVITVQDIAAENWAACQWLDSPREANEYLARVHVLSDGCVIAQWQNRAQTCTVLYRIDLRRKKESVDQSDSNVLPQPGSGRGRTLLVERSDVWINLHHMFHVLTRPIHPDECCHQNSSQSQQPPTRCPPMPKPLPEGSFSFLFASEQTGYSHLYLYTYCPGINGEQAVMLKPVTEGDWIVESILGVDLNKDVIYFTGTYDSALERHLYSVPLLGTENKHTWRYGATPAIARAKNVETQQSVKSLSIPTGTQSTALEASSMAISASNGSTVQLGLSKVINTLSGTVDGCNSVLSDVRNFEPDEVLLLSSKDGRLGPTRITLDRGMHNIVMDQNCRYFVDTSSDLDRPTTVKIYELPTDARMTLRCMLSLYDAVRDDVSITSTLISGESHEQGSIDLVKILPAPELLSFPTSDGTETLHAALYRPDPKIHGPGPYPLVCAVYGGPHVQRVNRSWSQSADMRAQRLRSLGFCLVKCDNRGSSRRGLAFESAISRRLGRSEVLDQVAAVRQLIVRGIVDPLRVGIYGWSYGGYLSAMCLCRAPDVFHVAVAGAPVTSWDGYDTHYTERYMGLPADNPAGYRESAVFDHVPNMRGKLLIVHGLIDENVHFRHTTRLINKLIAAGKDYDLLIFPEERHSPRRLRDRIYMEQRISEYFLRHLGPSQVSYPSALDIVTASLGHGGLPSMRTLAGHL